MNHQLTLGHHTWKSGAVALSSKGIRTLVRGSDLLCDSAMASAAQQILDSEKPKDDNEPEHSAAEEQLQRTIKTLQRKVDELTEENRQLRKSRHKNDDRADERDEASSRKASSASLADTIRLNARARGCSVGDLAAELNLSAADVRRFGFDEGELLPGSVLRAAGFVKTDASALRVDDQTGEVECSLMLPKDAAKVHADLQQRLGQ